MKKLHTLYSHLGLCWIHKRHILEWTNPLCPAQRHFDLLKDWVSQWVLKFEQTANWCVLTLFFHILFSVTEWNRILPGAVLFESWQLVDVTFSSYFKSSFHSKVKIWLLAVTFRCGWPCHTVKKWKHHLRLRYFNCHTRNGVFNSVTELYHMCQHL